MGIKGCRCCGGVAGFSGSGALPHLDGCHTSAAQAWLTDFQGGTRCSAGQSQPVNLQHQQTEDGGGGGGTNARDRHQSYKAGRNPDPSESLKDKKRNKDLQTR